MTASEAFLGFRTTLRKHAASGRQPLPPEVADQIRATYAALDRKIEAMPDVFVRPSASPSPGRRSPRG